VDPTSRLTESKQDAVRRSSGGAVLTSGASGTAIASFAQTFKEPYKTWVTISAPAATALIQLTWPYIQSWIVTVLIELNVWWKQWRTYRRIDGAIRILERQLKDRKNTPELKNNISQKLEILKLTKVDVAFDAAEPHIPKVTNELVRTGESQLVQEQDKDARAALL
jgi:hypothetical protein